MISGQKTREDGIITELTQKKTYGKEKEREDFCMKKVLSMFLAYAMTAVVLTGCSSSQGTLEQSTATEASVTLEESKESSLEETPGKADMTETADANGETGKEAVKVSQEAPGETVTLRIGYLKGPTTMGLAALMDKQTKEEAKGSYDFTMVTAADELVGKIVSGDLDIALVPANMASILYQKTNHGISVLNIHPLGVLYIVSADESITSIPDLKGKTIYMTGKGTTPDYVFQYLLSSNGLSKDEVTIEYKSEATEVAAILKEQPDAIGLLPQPFVTVAMAQNESLKMVMDLNSEWDNLQIEDGGRLVTGVTVCRQDVLKDKEQAVKLFLEEHFESADFANSHGEEAAQMVVNAGIIEKAPVAQKALPYCSIVCIDGEPMKEMLSGYLNVLYQQEPASVGGQLPDDGFYYLP